MPMDITRYPPNWREISLRIRERDGNCCKFCGVKNGAVGARDINGDWNDEADIHCMSSGAGISLFGEDFPKIIRIVLTVAHLNHDTTDNSDENLAALCQKCHLTYDAKHHASNAKVTRFKKKSAAIRESGQKGLFE